MDKNLDRLVLEFTRGRSFFIMPHWQSDGDCIGSALALTWGLRQLHKEVTVTLEDHIPEVFDYLPGYSELHFKRPKDQDVMVFVDGSDRSRFGPLFDNARATGKPLVQIDHHATNTRFADINWVDTSAGSCAELIYQLLKRLGVELDEAISVCLLTGILTDTLVFRTSSTTPDTLQAAVDLLKSGASIPTIVDRVYNRRPFNQLHLFGYVVSQARLEGVVCWSQVTQADYKKFGLSGNSTAGIINTLLTVDQAMIALLLTEREDGRIEVGLRSRVGYDVSEIAYALGGGGHKQASGALIQGTMETARKRVLAEIKGYLEEKAQEPIPAPDAAKNSADSISSR